jgi:hypothetical protein
VIPPRIGLSMEFSVGLMLIVLGIMNLTGVMRRMNGSRLIRAAAYQLVRPAVVGVVHGLAGSAAVALLILTTIRNPAWALWYVLVFGLGTIVGMMLMTAVIVVPFTRTSHSVARFGGGLRIASGVISLALGLFVAYRVGLVDGLFTGNPDWTPY